MTLTLLKASVCSLLSGVCSFAFVVMAGYFNLNFVLFEEESEEMDDNERVTAIESTDQEITDTSMNFEGKIKQMKMFGSNLAYQHCMFY